MFSDQAQRRFDEAKRPLRVLRLRDVKARTGKSQTAIYADMAAGTFPRPIPIGPQTRGWLESEIEDWILARKAARDAGDNWQQLGTVAGSVVAKVVRS
jgi:prophage regulatory protein